MSRARTLEPVRLWGPWHPAWGRLFVFLRHGESLANALEVRQGIGQFPLTARGLAQVHHLARQWRRQGYTFDRIITSPLHRAFHTALILAQALNVAHIDVEPLWQERRIGRYTGRPARAVAQEAVMDPATRFTRVGGYAGESPWDLYARALAAWGRLLRLSPGRYLVVTHGGLLNTLFRALLGLPPRAHFGDVRIFLGNLGYAVWWLPPGEHQPRLLALQAQPVQVP